MATTSTKSKPLIIVESPTKARTLSRILGKGYRVLSSQGHVRDLPDRELGVDIENGYEPKFRIIGRKSKVVKSLRDAAKEAQAVMLATDPDREGEAIAWHLAELINRPVQRVEFREFTPRAVQDAVKHPHDINRRRVDAQLARRVLDRLVGYRISPVLWRKVRRGLSAGRVQSVAVRLICEREEEIRAFKPQEYWTLEGRFAGDGVAFAAQLVEVDGRRIVHPSKEQNSGTRIIASEEEAKALLGALLPLKYAVDSVQEKKISKSPAPPFITATLQQAAFKKLGFQGKRTMRVAQQLYEGIDVGEGLEGLITYMRTDSVRVAAEFVEAARQHISTAFGKSYLPDKPRAWKSRSGAQEAHEAIRPTNLAYAPERVKGRLSPDQLKVYTLIYNRFLASQMANALHLQRQTEVVSAGGDVAARFRHTATTVGFDGFLRVYREENNENEKAKSAGSPAGVHEGMVLDLKELAPSQHFTKPLPRYTEASLIKTLEEFGIGRPSTYAPILDTIVERGYVEREGRNFAPTEWAFLVIALMKDFFPEVVDVDFTARMEARLDLVEEGKGRWQELVDSFYQPLAKEIEQALADRTKKYKPEARELDEKCPECGKPLVERSGRYGKFIACSGYPECRYVKRDNGAKGNAVKPLDERCPKCGAQLVARRNRWGWEFVACSTYPKCDFAREPQLRCPKCGGALNRRQAKNRRVFYVCENSPAPGEDEKTAAGKSCDFVLFGRPTVDKCELCGWFIAERKQRDKVLRFCSNPDCANHSGIAAPDTEKE